MTPPQDSPHVVPPSRRLPAWGSLALTLFGLAVLTPGLGSTRVLTHHETFNTQPAREMLETGQWVVPTFGGTTIAERPPLTIWLIAASLVAAGGVDEFAVRLPTVLAAILTANLIARLAARLHGPAVSLIAGAIQLTSFYVFMQARLAEPDMLLCAAVTLAMTAFCEGVILRPADPKRSATFDPLRLQFFAGVGLAFLAKGPLGLVFIGGGIGLYALLRLAETRSFAEPWRFVGFGVAPLGWVVAAVCLVGWPAAAVYTRPDLFQDWMRENLGRFAGDLGHRQHPLYYAGMLPALLLPWTPFALAGAALIGLRRDRRWVGPLETGGLRSTLKADDAGLAHRFLLCWLAAGMAVLQAAAFKHKHYMIPLLPAASVAAAVGFDAWTRIRWTAKWPTWAVSAAAAAGIVAAVIVLPREVPAAGADLAGAVTLACVGVAIAFGVGGLGWRRAHVLTTLATAAVVGVLVETRVVPHYDSYRDQATFAKRVNGRVPDGTAIEVVGLPENHVTAYLRGPLQIHDEPTEFAADVPRTGPRYAVMFAREAEKLGDAGTVVDRCDTLRKRETEATRLVLVEVEVDAGPVRFADASTDGGRIH
ncbi:MAG: glycosyltransferase family 39 protein [Planctomycetota bacterium]